MELIKVRQTQRFHADFLNTIKQPIQTNWNSKNSRENLLRSSNQSNQINEKSSYFEEIQGPENINKLRGKKDKHNTHNLLFNQFSSRTINQENSITMNQPKSHNLRYSSSFPIQKNDYMHDSAIKQSFLFDQSKHQNISDKAQNSTFLGNNFSLSTPVKSPNRRYDHIFTLNDFEQEPKPNIKTDSREHAHQRQRLQKRIMDLQNSSSIYDQDQDSSIPLPNFDICHHQYDEDERIPGAPSSNRYEKRDQFNFNITDVVECISFTKKKSSFKKSLNI